MFPVMLLAAASIRCPRLVIPSSVRPMAAAQDRAPRIIRKGGAGHVRLMRLFPRVSGTVRTRHLVHRMMQPGMPLGGHFRPLRLAIIYHPALFAAEPPAAASCGPVPPLAVVAITIVVNA